MNLSTLFDSWLLRSLHDSFLQIEALAEHSSVNDIEAYTLWLEAFEDTAPMGRVH